MNCPKCQTKMEEVIFIGSSDENFFYLKFEPLSGIIRGKIEDNFVLEER